MKNNLSAYDLTRFQQDEKATLGNILYNNVSLCYTLELPWKNNQHDISCIPEGKYKCVAYISPKSKKDVWLLLNVPGRKEIEIHIGNFIINSIGCILVGDQISNYKNYPVINNSDKTMAKLKIIMPKEFWLNINCLNFSNILT